MGAVFVIDGHDIELCPDVDSAAEQIEGYDAMRLEYFGTDGTVYAATVQGAEWGPVTLHATERNRLGDLIRLLRAEALHRGLSLPSTTPDDPAAIWDALNDAQRHQREEQRSRRSRAHPGTGHAFGAFKDPWPHDPRLDPFRDAVWELSRYGHVTAYLTTTVGRMQSFPFFWVKQEWLWYQVHWLDGRHERAREDYGPDWLTVAELESGCFQPGSEDQVLQARPVIEPERTRLLDEYGPPD